MYDTKEAWKQEIAHIAECFWEKHSRAEHFQKKYEEYLEACRKAQGNTFQELKQIIHGILSGHKAEEFLGWRRAYQISWYYLMQIGIGDWEEEAAERKICHILEDNMDCFDEKDANKFLILEVSVKFLYEAGSNIPLFYPLRQAAKIYNLMAQMSEHYEECDAFYGEAAGDFLLDRIFQYWDLNEIRKAEKAELNEDVYYQKDFYEELKEQGAARQVNMIEQHIARRDAEEERNHLERERNKKIFNKRRERKKEIFISVITVVLLLAAGLGASFLFEEFYRYIALILIAAAFVLGKSQ